MIEKEPTLSNRDLVGAYLHSFYSGNFEEAKTVVSDDFHFKGPFVEANTKGDFFTSAARLAAIVHGHKLLRQWADGNDVCSIFELRLKTPVGAGSVEMSEWHTLCGGKLAAGRLLFDSAAFRALFPQR